MTPLAEAVLNSWPVDPWLWAGLLGSILIYLRGWRVLSWRDPERWPRSQPFYFTGSMIALFLALGSPLEPFTGLLLQAHMAQHLLLVMVAPPLFWRAAPFFPLLRGLPAWGRSLLAPLLRQPALQKLFTRLTHPLGAWLIFVAVTWTWHLPALYQLALRSEGWHYVQHLCFLGAGLLFWYPVERPFPANPTWSRWLLIPYLLLADIQNTVLSALFTFSDTVFYEHYAQVPRLGGWTALEDQAAAGVLMWVPGSVGYLVPLGVIGLGLLYGAQPRPRRLPLPVLGQAPEPRVDLLRLPLVGRLLRWRYTRLALQLPLLLLAGIIVVDGLAGPQVAPLNLAGVLPWIHWRGLLVLALLAMGNVFCLACPFLLPRQLARWVRKPQATWPRLLRNKWPAVALVALFLWSYEAFALWDRPWTTAWIIGAYFLAALILDTLFRHAPFCKYVCPIGQFNFVQSLVSPFEVRVRDSITCETCTGKECIRGASTGPGCELALYLPRKEGNMDCTFCLDCVHACPHDNIEIGPRIPGAELWEDRQRAGIGRFGQRWDLVALMVLLVFGAFANAAGMIAPVVEQLEQWRVSLGVATIWPIVTLFYLVALGLWPLIALTLAAGMTTLLGWNGSVAATVRRFAWCLVPLGCAMWVSHYAFHLVTGYDAVVPAVGRVGFDLGWWAAAPEWVCSCCAAVPGWLLRAEILLLDLGYLLSLYTAFRLAERRLLPTLPWAVLLTILFALGVWILLEPMQMRGTMAGLG
ncbi:MAG: cytochrome c oxidase assembly protein [Gemmataceae bacterium]